MKQLFAFMTLIVIATCVDAVQGTAVSQTYIQYGNAGQVDAVNYSNRKLQAKRRYAPGPRRLNSQIYYRHVPRMVKKAYKLALPQARRTRYKRFSGYFEQRLPHLENGYYKAWPYYYKYKYGFGQPYTPYFSSYFTPFNDGYFTWYFQN